MYNTLRRHYYWPGLAVDCYSTLRNFVECAKERVRLRKRLTGLKLFPARAPFENIAMYLLGPFLETLRGNIHLLVIDDRYSKLYVQFRYEKLQISKLLMLLRHIGYLRTEYQTQY